MGLRTLIIFFLSLSITIGQATPFRERWQNFCERHLIDEDPYQDLEPLWQMKKHDPEGHTGRTIEKYSALGIYATLYPQSRSARKRLWWLGIELRRLPMDLIIDDALNRYAHLEITSKSYPY